jgi:lipopolysaccharide transport system permease protein
MAVSGSLQVPARSRLTRLSDLARLVGYMTYAELRAEAERTYVRYLWWVVEPLLSLAVYYVVFTLILTRRIDNYALFLFVGLVPWRWLNTTVLHGSLSIVSARGLIRQVRVPKLLFPLVAILSDATKFLVIFGALTLLLPFFGFPLTWAHLALPLVVLAQGALVVGVTLCAATVVPLVPDLQIILQNLLRLWLFLSGIFYEVSAFSPSTQAYFRLNPMVPVIEAYRAILLEGTAPDLTHVMAITVISSVIGGIGIMAMNRLDFVYTKLAF